jgi:hypothetical protein
MSGLSLMIDKSARSRFGISNNQKQLVQNRPKNVIKNFTMQEEHVEPFIQLLQYLGH